MNRAVISAFMAVCPFIIIYSQSYEDLKNKTEQYAGKGDYQSAAAFAEKAKIRAQYEFGAQSLQFASALETSGDLYEKMDNYEKAAQELSEGIKIRKKILGPYHADYITGLSHLIKLYEKSARYSKTETLYLEFLEIIKNLLGETNPTYSSVMTSLAETYLRMGDYKKAEKTFVRAISLKVENPGSNHSDYKAALNGLAMTYIQMGKYAQADSVFSEYLKMQKSPNELNSPEFALFLNNLATLYEHMGYFNKADSACNDALAIFKKNSGTNSLNYGNCLITAGEINQKMGDYPKAEELYQEACKIIKETVGTNHPDYASSINSLALLYHDLGQYEREEILYKEASAIYRRVLDPDHIDYGNSINNLALLYYKTGRYQEAEPLFLESLRITRESLGTDNPGYAFVLSNIASFYLAIGNYLKAEGFFVEASNIFKNIYGPDHIDYATSLNLLAELYYLMGNYPQAELNCNIALKIREKTLGKNHPDYATSLRNLAMIYNIMGNNSKSEELYKEAINITKARLSTSHPEYGFSLNDLAQLYTITGNYSEAEKLFAESSAIIEKSLGQDHPNYAESLFNEALLYYITGNYSKAESLFKKTNQNLNKQINNNFNFLSEREKEQFVANKANIFFDIYHSFIFKYKEKNPFIISDIYNNELAHKGMLMESNTSLRNAVYSGKDTSLISAYNNLIEIRKKLNALYSAPFTGSKDYTSSLEDTADVLEKNILNKGRHLAGIENLAGLTNIKWQDVQQALKPDEAAIEFVDFGYYLNKWTDSILYCALVLRKGYPYPRMIYLFEEKQLQELLETNDQSSDYSNIEKIYGYNSDQTSTEKYKNCCNMLYCLIWKPIDNLLNGVRTVYISPSGLLNRISFNAIPLSEKLLLLDKYDINIVSSTRNILKATNADDNYKSDFKAVLYGGIEYDIDSAEMILLAQKSDKCDNGVPLSRKIYIPDNQRGIKWSFLPGTLTEVTEIHKLFEANKRASVLYTGKNATEESFKYLTSDIKSPEVIHIATHGFFFADALHGFTSVQVNDMFRTGNSFCTTFINSPDPLLRSGILFAGANRAWKNLPAVPGIEDGVLSAAEVSNLDLSNTTLATLSACETGLGDIKGSEGVYGLQRAFKLAGVKNIIMSLWKITDAQTSELMQLFYKNMLSGMKIKDALKEVQKVMRTKYDPYYWAGFVLIK